MNILQISANDNRIGGASGIALKIKEELDNRNIENSFFCGLKSSNLPNVFKIPKSKSDRIKSFLFADDMSFFKTDFILETEQFKKGKKIDGYTPAQRFFLSWAQVWRINVLPETEQNLIKTDPHSPGIHRANAPITNIDAWYKAFNIKKIPSVLGYHGINNRNIPTADFD